MLSLCLFNPDISTPEKQKNISRNTPWGEMSYLNYKKKIEFGLKEFREKEYIFPVVQRKITFKYPVEKRGDIYSYTKYTKTYKKPGEVASCTSVIQHPVTKKKCTLE